MLGQDSFLGSLLVLPVEMLNGIAIVKYTETGGNYGYPNWMFGCSAQVTEPNSTQHGWYVGMQ